MKGRVEITNTVVSGRSTKLGDEVTFGFEVGALARQVVGESMLIDLEISREDYEKINSPNGKN